MHRQFADELASWLMDAPLFSVDDVVQSLAAFAVAYEPKPKPLRTVFIDEDVTWRNDAARRLLADPTATDLFFTDKGVLQVTRLDIDFAPEVKELIGPSKAPSRPDVAGR